MKVSGTVTTVSPSWTPAATRAKRSASVPLATPTQTFDSQNSEKSRSNSCTTGPPMNPAVSRAVSKTDRSSSRSSRCTVTSSRNGISPVLMRRPRPGRCARESSSHGPRAPGDGPQQTRRVSGHDRVGGHVTSHDASGPDQGVFTDREVGEDRRTGSDRGSLPHQRGLDVPILLRLQLAARSRGARVGIVDERDTVADEDVVFDRHPFADERVAGNLAALPYLGVLLDFHKGTDLGVVTHLTAVEIDLCLGLQIVPPPHLLLSSGQLCSHLHRGKAVDIDVRDHVAREVDGDERDIHESVQVRLAGRDHGFRLLLDEIVHDRKVMRREIPDDADVVLKEPQ